MSEFTLFTVPPIFDGVTYDREHDEHRLNSQLDRVQRLMGDGQWRTLRQIADAVEGSEAGVSARLRDLRKARWGAATIERRRVAGGLFEYRLKGTR